MRRFSDKRVWVLIILIASAQLFLQYYLLFGIAGGRYRYHCDNLWRAVYAYKWAQSPFFTWDPVKLPLEYALYGSALKFWPKPLATIPAVNILLAGGTVVFLALSILVRSLWTIAHYHQPDNRNYLGALRHLMEMTGPEETVMDGWTGLGVFRPHAYYYYYVHQGIWMMLSEDEKGEQLLSALQNSQPKVIISGPYLEKLSPEVINYIETNYQPLQTGHPFLLRKIYSIGDKKGKLSQ